MHRAGEFLGEGFIDEPVSVEQAFSLESVSDNANLEMRLAPGA